MIDIDLSGKKFLVMGVANKRSLGWAIAEQLHAAGAQLAFSYQAERLKDELGKLTAEMNDTLLYQCDVVQEDELEAMFSDLKGSWGHLDGIVHAIAFAPREALEGRVLQSLCRL